MDIRQLAFVLEHIVSSIEDYELLVRYEQLILALKQIDVEAVNQCRMKVIDAHEAADPSLFSAEKRAILISYHADKLLGQPTIDHIQNLFVTNFMQPKAIIVGLQTLYDETEQLLERATQLLGGLEPALAQMPADEYVEPEIVNHSVHISERRGVLQVIRERVSGSQSTALVPLDNTPLKIKVAAALPIALAAAGKAVDLYRLYAEHKSNAVVRQQTTNHPIRTQPPVTNIYSSYRQTIIFTNRD